jgi:hypothetical protein
LGLPRRDPAFAALRVALSALEGRSAVTALTVTPLAFGKQVVLEWQGPKGPVRTTLVSSEPHVAPEWRLVSSSKAGGPSLHLDSAEHFPSIVVFPNRPGRAPAKIIYTEGPDGTLRRELGVIGKGGITTEVTHVRKGPRARDGAWRPRGR